MTLTSYLNVLFCLSILGGASVLLNTTFACSTLAEEQLISSRGFFKKFLSGSDHYTGKIPQPFENEEHSIRYSIPAIQGMERNRISPIEVEGLLKSSGINSPQSKESNGKIICQNHICVVFNKLTISSKIEVSSVWKE